MPCWALPTRGSCKTSVTTPPLSQTALQVPQLLRPPSCGGSLSFPPSQPSCCYPTLIPSLGWALPIMISPGSAHPWRGEEVWFPPYPSLFLPQASQKSPISKSSQGPWRSSRRSFSLWWRETEIPRGQVSHPGPLQLVGGRPSLGAHRWR